MKTMLRHTKNSSKVLQQQQKPFPNGKTVIFKPMCPPDQNRLLKHRRNEHRVYPIPN